MEKYSNLKAYLVVTALVLLMLLAMMFVFLFVLIAGIILSPVIIQIMFNVLKSEKFVLLKRWKQLKRDLLLTSLFYYIQDLLEISKNCCEPKYISLELHLENK